MILDTNAVSDLFSGDERLALVLGNTRRHHLPSVVVGEYRYGLLGSSKQQVLVEMLEVLLGASILLPVDGSTAKHYALVRDQLKRNGTPIPENDVWIAALARQHDQPVVTRDVHFDAVEGLRRLSW